MSSELCGSAQDAVAKLSNLLRNHPAETAEELTEAVRCVVALRDRMIEVRRRGGLTSGQDRRLRRVNAAISAIVAGEFPLIGIRWKRIEGARDLLKEVLAEEQAEAAAAGAPG